MIDWETLRQNDGLLTLGFTILSALVLVPIGFLIKRKFFPDSKGTVNHGESSVAMNSTIEKGVAIGGSASVAGNVVGGDQSVSLTVNQPIFALVKQRQEKEAEDPEAKRLAVIMKRSQSTENTKAVLEMFYGTKKKSIKIQTALVLAAWYDPLENSAFEFTEIMNEAIGIAREAGLVREPSALLAHKAKFISFMHLNEDQNYNIYLAHRSLGSEIKKGIERELAYKDKITTDLLAEATELAKQSDDIEVILAVYTERMNVTARRAANFRISNLAKYPEEKKAVRDTYAEAGAILSQHSARLETKGELESANLKHNFVNDLRLSEPSALEEAIRMEKEAVEVAEKYGDHSLILRSKTLLKGLEGAPVPDYANGEKGGFSI